MTCSVQPDCLCPDCYYKKTFNCSQFAHGCQCLECRYSKKKTTKKTSWKAALRAEQPLDIPRRVKERQRRVRVR